MQTILQVLVRGFNTLGGHVRKIFNSFFTAFSPSRTAFDPVSTTAAARSQFDTAGADLSAARATPSDDRLDLWDMVLRCPDEMLFPSSTAELRFHMPNNDGNADQAFLVFALMAAGHRQVRLRKFVRTGVSGRGRRPSE